MQVFNSAVASGMTGLAVTGHVQSMQLEVCVLKGMSSAEGRKTVLYIMQVIY